MSESKVNIELYRNFFIQEWVKSGEVDDSQAVTLMNHITKVVNTHLQCVTCNQILPDEDFYSQKVYVARRQRSTDCRECIKNKRSELRIKQ